jgi:hypothetical protein
MNRRLVPLVTCLLVLALAATAQAQIIYSFTTTTPSTDGGSVSGSFTVPESAIAKGVINPADIATFSFTNAPPFGGVFHQATWAPPDQIVAATSIPVDPATGLFSAPGFLGINDTQSLPAQILSFLTMPAPAQEMYGLSSAGFGSQLGEGRWSVSPEPSSMPEPSSILLFGVAGSGLLVYGIRRRFLQRKGNG